MISGFTHINKIWVSIFNYHVIDTIMKLWPKKAMLLGRLSLLDKQNFIPKFITSLVVFWLAVFTLIID